MDHETLAATYQLVGELLLHPHDRDPVRVATGRRVLDSAPPVVTAALAAFDRHPDANSADAYVHTVELAPPCPLYLGAYLFDEPSTCRDIGLSERNRYMLELVGIYRHFGFELEGGELPDFLPVVVDFLWLSRVHGTRDRIGLRRRLLERFVRPALGPLREGLERHKSPYAHLIVMLEAAVTADRELLGDQPAWTPPAPERRRELPVLTGARPPTPWQEERAP